MYLFYEHCSAVLVSICLWKAPRNRIECAVGCQTPGAGTSPYLGSDPALESRATALWWCRGRRSVFCLSVTCFYNMFVNTLSSVIFHSTSICLSLHWITLCNSYLDLTDIWRREVNWFKGSSLMMDWSSGEKVGNGLWHPFLCGSTLCTWAQLKIQKFNRNENKYWNERTLCSRSAYKLAKLKGSNVGIWWPSLIMPAFMKSLLLCFCMYIIQTS